MRVYKTIKYPLPTKRSFDIALNGNRLVVCHGTPLSQNLKEYIKVAQFFDVTNSYAASICKTPAPRQNFSLYAYAIHGGCALQLCIGYFWQILLFNDGRVRPRKLAWYDHVSNILPDGTFVGGRFGNRANIYNLRGDGAVPIKIYSRILNSFDLVHVAAESLNRQYAIFVRPNDCYMIATIHDGKIVATYQERDDMRLLTRFLRPKTDILALGDGKLAVCTKCLRGPSDWCVSTVTYVFDDEGRVIDRKITPNFIARGAINDNLIGFREWGAGSDSNYDIYIASGQASAPLVQTPMPAVIAADGTMLAVQAATSDDIQLYKLGPRTIEQLKDKMVLNVLGE